MWPPKKIIPFHAILNQEPYARNFDFKEKQLLTRSEIMYYSNYYNDIIIWHIIDMTINNFHYEYNYNN